MCGCPFACVSAYFFLYVNVSDDGRMRHGVVHFMGGQTVSCSWSCVMPDLNTQSEANCNHGWFVPVVCDCHAPLKKLCSETTFNDCYITIKFIYDCHLT